MAAREFLIKTNINQIFFQYLMLAKTYFESYLTVLNKNRGEDGNLVPVTLAKKELQVLALLLLFNHSQEGEELFSLKNKKNIIKQVGISQYYLNNIINDLRKKKVVYGSKLNRFFIIDPKDVYELKFKFELNG